MIDINMIIIFITIFIVINVVLLLVLLAKKVYFLKKQVNENRYINYFINNYEETYMTIKIKKDCQNKIILKLLSSLIFNQEQKEKINYIIENNLIDKKYCKKLFSKSCIKRKEAAVFLGMINNEISINSLKKAFIEEKNYSVKLYISNSLCRLNVKESISEIIKSLIDSPEHYQKRIRGIILNFKDFSSLYITEKINTDKDEIKKLIIDYLLKYSNDDVLKYVLNLAKSDENFLIKRYAVNCLSKNYYEFLNDKIFLENSDLEIRKIAIKSLSGYLTERNILNLIEYLKDDETYDIAMYSISQILHSSPKLIYFIINLFKKEKNIDTKSRIAKILSIRIEFFLYKLLSEKKEETKEIIKEILLAGKTSEIIVFLNKNQNISLEKEILSILSFVLKKNQKVKKEISLYLNENLLKKLKLKKDYEEPLYKKPQKELSKIISQTIILTLTISIPLSHFLIYYGYIFTTFLGYVRGYVLYFNYFLGFYFILVNLIYVVLLILSFFNQNKQYKLWHLKDNNLLFRKNMLPTISIIAPAFNEEATIEESVNSLLNLNYPDYELIVVNDGSKDKTLETLKKIYFLEKSDYVINKKLKTRPVRGVYLNPNIPNLIVIDKENGGKADSLNVGINLSTKDYICGIDSDSILEKDALLKITSMSIDSKYETVAIGGNIIPVNNCKVDRGKFLSINTPKNIFAKFQTVEYIRAFLAGRLGWAYINSLLIISGAFGLFKRNVVEEIGGYLTESEKYEKNTVGEDMELVVRIASELKENNIPYKIEYCYNANCWTEVPEKFKILKKQRDRWQRGLIDILNFHKKKIFNPKYGNMGILGLPYYLLIEIIGPIIETKGYILFLAGLLLGVLNLHIVLFLFLSSILFGISVSLSSLIIGENETNKFGIKDTLNLIFFAILENFGFRQYLSTLRFSGFLSSLFNKQGWGKMERKGLKKF